ncbi:MAG: U32 family peptidase [Alloprevotella sp.]|nr:U32 family peptidase [Alloprevotella sp.]
MERSIELLAPARTADIGIEAIRHGADAVYIGAEDFGARAAAGNSAKDIGRLCDFAHQFGARVYVTLNTILYDDELAAAERLVRELHAVGTDALIVQDMSLLRLDLPPIALHASTQMDVTTPEKALFLHRCGFRQIVLARELSILQIKEISDFVPAKLEAFVHGALCVSYSGRCYASEACFGRSANRGRCAQFCRLAFDLEDADGRTVVHAKHLLSLRDMNRSCSLEEMMDAGVSSFKIEGRLKGMDYVKNVTAYYRRRMDDILRRRDDLVRSSFGTSETDFEPRLEKSFNRGFTEYFLHGRTPVLSADTPKAIGEYVGIVERRTRQGLGFHVSGDVQLHAGDGLCYLTPEGKMEGVRVNRVEGGEVMAARRVSIPVGTRLFRNLDYAFTHRLEKETAKRKMRLDMRLSETPTGYALHLEDEAGRSFTLQEDAEHAEAHTPQEEAVRRQLSRLGDTPYEAGSISIQTEGERFIPASKLGDWRRRAVEGLLLQPARRPEDDAETSAPQTPPRCPRQLDNTANVANREARAFYEACGAEEIAPAFEIKAPADATLMTCRHCIRYALGACTRYGGKKPAWREPLSLRLPDGRRFPLEFDCKRCEMKVSQA